MRGEVGRGDSNSGRGGVPLEGGEEVVIGESILMINLTVALCPRSSVESVSVTERVGRIGNQAVMKRNKAIVRSE